MATRQLSRLKLPPGIAAKLDACNIRTAKDLYSKTAVDLSELLDLPPATIQSLLQHVSQSIMPVPVTASDLLKQSDESPAYLRTLLGPLDTALLGGLRAGTITELVGPAGLGKTQFCLGMCIVGCLDRLSQGGKVLYIDTEQKFSAERLAQIARERFPDSFPFKDSIITMLDRVLVQKTKTSTELLALLEGLQSEIIDHNIKLVIIDSIAALARSDFGIQNLVERQRMLGQQASRLKFLAESFRIPCLVTNQVTTNFFDRSSTAAGGVGGSSLTAALGPMWAHAVNTRLVMSAQQDPREPKQQLRVLTIAKSPSSPILSIPYQVTSKGVEWLQGVEPSPMAPGSVLDMVIANYQSYEAMDGHL